MSIRLAVCIDIFVCKKAFKTTGRAAGLGLGRLGLGLELVDVAVGDTHRVMYR